MGAMWQKVARSYPPQFELIPLALLGVSVYLVWTYLPQLPARVPRHFNIQGLPDGWGSPSSILSDVAVGAGMYLLLTVINVLLARAKDPRGLINLPRKRKEALTPAQVEQLRLLLNRCLFAMKVLIEGLFTYSTYITIEVALGRADRLGAPFFLILAALLALAGYMTWKSFSMTKPSPGPTGYR